MFENKKEKPGIPHEFSIPPLCGVEGCTENTAVYMRSAGISRCTSHYQADVDAMGRSSNPRAAQVMADLQRDAELDVQNA